MNGTYTGRVVIRHAPKDSCPGGVVLDWPELRETVAGQFTCPRCGRALEALRARPIFGVKSSRAICNVLCLDAVGPDCECSCAGKNHGKSYLYGGPQDQAALF